MRCGVYLHIPYCSRKCDYCAFHSTAHWTTADQHALIDKIISDAKVFSAREPAFPLHPVEAKTLYIGGGTPSILGRGLLARLIGGVTIALGDPQEMTCEANPESASPEFLAEAAGAGVTRLSVGVQSLSAHLCSVIGRRTPRRVELDRIRSGWEGPLSADLITGIPGQTTEDLLADATQLVEMGFSHLSIYDLSVEANTPLARRVASGSVAIPENGPDWQTVCGTLAGFSFVRYEVSSFALPGHESRHNLGYWRTEPYLGLGPSATSTLPAGERTVRFTQPRNHADYLRGHPFHCADSEYLNSNALITEYVMLGLRTAEGVSIDRLRGLLGADLDTLLEHPLAELNTRELLVREEDWLRPTARGMDLLNRVVVELLGELHGGEQPQT